VILSDFTASCAAARPPSGLGAALEALWWAAKGDWDKAHKIVMDEESADAAWVHAYLHRQEGDLPNAGYWYRTAGTGRHRRARGRVECGRGRAARLSFTETFQWRFPAFRG